MPLSLLNARVLCVRPIGRTSDFCPVCRRQSRFRLALAERRRYFLCFDQGSEGQPHHELTCMTCGCKCERPAEERPVEVIPHRTAAEHYEPESLPIVKSRVEDCIAMEQARMDGKLKPKDREEMIRYTMFSFARIYDEDPFERIKPWVMLVMVLMIVALAVFGVIAMQHSGTMTPLYAAGGAIFVIITTLLYWVTTHSPRKRVRTWLATALLPLDPSREELRRARREMQASRIRAGDAIRSDKVLAKMKKLKAII